ncbi:hypothetical protein [Photobacterium arenosum]|uniref:hypothetical protein n=1 Tax=Photobacterium arenosum TaxID=2774143 RepID=UPI00288A3BA8|nr:hypothetical protein [Photobacterium arenosum]
MGNEMVWPSRELVIQQEESTLALKAELHRYIIEQLEEDGLMFEMERQEMQPHVHDYVRQYFQQHKELNQHLNIQDLVTELMDEIVGFGPLQNLLDDPNIDDILINGPEKHLC